MTTKLLPRLIATAALATALTGVSAATGLITSAHATPVVTQGAGGSIDVTLPYSDVKAAAAELANAQALCQKVIVPAADAISPNALRVTTCTSFTHLFSSSLLSSQKSIVISFITSQGQVTAHTV